MVCTGFTVMPGVSIGKMNIEEMRQRAEVIELENYRFYKQAAERSQDPQVKTLLLELAEAEKGHESIAVKLGLTHLTADAKIEEGEAKRRLFLLQGLCDGLLHGGYLLPGLEPERQVHRSVSSNITPAGARADATPARRASIARGWAALAQEARQRGHEPLPPACHEIPLEGLPGAVAAICLDDTHAQAVILRAKAEGRTVSVWTLAEVVRVIQASEVVNQVKHLWPGAEVQKVRQRVPELPADEIPFGGDEGANA